MGLCPNPWDTVKYTEFQLNNKTNQWNITLIICPKPWAVVLGNAQRQRVSRLFDTHGLGDQSSIDRWIDQQATRLSFQPAHHCVCLCVCACMKIVFFRSFSGGSRKAITQQSPIFLFKRRCPLSLIIITGAAVFIKSQAISVLTCSCVNCDIYC